MKVYVSHPINYSVEEILNRLNKKYPDVLFVSPAYGLFTVNKDKDPEYRIELLKSCDEVIFCGDWLNDSSCMKELTYCYLNRVKKSFIDEWLNKRDMALPAELIEEHKGRK
ncbi:MAG: hypothetical protein K0M69_18245 [Youngiibacter sp.]|nr:hypothetical protein [Youngiibacter sp.]